MAFLHLWKGQRSCRLWWSDGGLECGADGSMWSPWRWNCSRRWRSSSQPDQPWHVVVGSVAARWRLAVFHEWRRRQLQRHIVVIAVMNRCSRWTSVRPRWTWVRHCWTAVCPRWTSVRPRWTWVRHCWTSVRICCYHVLWRRQHGRNLADSINRRAGVVYWPI